MSRDRGSIPDLPSLLKRRTPIAIVRQSQSDLEVIMVSFPARFSRAFINDPAKAGQQAAGVFTFGPLSRYGVRPVHTRFDSVEWMVTDAEQIDKATSLAEIIRQESTLEEAVEGLEMDDPWDDSLDC